VDHHHRSVRRGRALLFLSNLVWSFFKGKPAGGNPWRATTLEWQTPDTRPRHGNWGERLPVVYRWAYDYSVPGAKEDFIPPKTFRPTSWRRSCTRTRPADRAHEYLGCIRRAHHRRDRLVVADQTPEHAIMGAATDRACTCATRAADVGEVGVPPARIALWVFLAVITSLFGLFISAYFIRMGHGMAPDMASRIGIRSSKPSILWFNSAMLVLSRRRHAGGPARGETE